MRDNVLNDILEALGNRIGQGSAERERFAEDIARVTEDFRSDLLNLSFQPGKQAKRAAQKLCTNAQGVLDALKAIGSYGHFELRQGLLSQAGITKSSAFLADLDKFRDAAFLLRDRFDEQEQPSPKYWARRVTQDVALICYVRFNKMPGCARGTPFYRVICWMFQNAGFHCNDPYTTYVRPTLEVMRKNLLSLDYYNTP